jgi:hypothetical protein
MTLSEHLKKEQLEKVISVWGRMNWIDRKLIAIDVLLHAAPRRVLLWFQSYLMFRRAKYAYWYPAHWIGRKS